MQNTTNRLEWQVTDNKKKVSKETDEDVIWHPAASGSCLWEKNKRKLYNARLLAIAR
jgi:hypothetical protein